MPQPQLTPLTQAELQHLADYTLERLAEGFASNDGQTGQALEAARAADLGIALCRLIGAVAGDAAELRLLAMLNLPADYLFGSPSRSIAVARACAAADKAASAGVPA